MKVLVAAVYGETITCRLIGAKAPVVGNEYRLEDARGKTQAQNKTLHMLIRMYFVSGCYSDPASDEKQLKEFLLFRLGKGFEKWLYWNGEKLAQTEHEHEIPEEILNAPNRRDLIFGKLHRWSEYTIPEGRTLIKAIMAEMIAVGVSGKEFEEVMQEFHNG